MKKISNLILMVFTLAFAQRIYHSWEPFPKSILKTLGEQGFASDVITNMVYCIIFGTFLCFAVRAVSGCIEPIVPWRVFSCIAIYLGCQLVADAVRLTLAGSINRYVFIVNDLLTLAVLFGSMRIMIAVTKTKIEKLRLFYALCIGMMSVILIGAVILDFRSIAHIVKAEAKYSSDYLEIIKMNAEYNYGIRNALLEFLCEAAVMIALFVSAPNRRIGNSEESEENDFVELHRYEKRKNVAVFGTRLFAVYIACVLLVSLRTAILPQNNIMKGVITDSVSEKLVADWESAISHSYFTETVYRKDARGEDKAEFVSSEGSLFFKDEKLLEYNFEGEAQLDKVRDIDGVEVRIYDDQALGFVVNFQPTAMKFSDLPEAAENNILLGLCREMIAKGDIVTFEYTGRYLAKYDRDFVGPYLERYANGEFTDSEMQTNTKLRMNYISDTAREILMSFSK